MMQTIPSRIWNMNMTSHPAMIDRRGAERSARDIWSDCPFLERKKVALVELGYGVAEGLVSLFLIRGLRKKNENFIQNVAY